MKHITNILTALTLAVVFSAAAAHAQSGGQRMTVNIPFEFNAGKLSFPAGQYEFMRTGDGLYMVRDSQGHGQMILAGAAIQPNAPTEKSNLKFAVVDGRHVLVQIWSDLSAIGNDFPSGSSSLEIDKRAADVVIPSGR